jgi:threonine aldolase
LFVPTGTLGNLVALKVHTQPGEEVIVEARSHIYDCELAGMSSVCGLLARPLLGNERGMLRWEDVRRHIRPRVYTRSQTRLVCLENTHNFAGGTIPDQHEVDELCEQAHERELRMHLDGARLANASAATGETLARLSAGFDSVMVDFAKGLGAPAGAAIAGTVSFIERARSVRKMLGGAIHQAGILAAACLYGLEHVLPRLREDHLTAGRLADALRELPGLVVENEKPMTNIVIVRLPQDSNPDAVCAALKRRGVLVNPLENRGLRFVTHCDIGGADLENAIAALHEVFSPTQSYSKHEAVS